MKYQVVLINAFTQKISKPLATFATIEEATSYQKQKNNVLRFNQAPQRALVVEVK